MDRGTNHRSDVEFARLPVLGDCPPRPRSRETSAPAAAPPARRTAERDPAIDALLLESLDDAVIAYSIDGAVRVWNPAAARLFGYAPADILGRPITCIVPPDRGDELARVHDLLRRGERVERFESVGVHRDGGAVHVSMTVSPLRDASGALLGTTIVARDVSDRQYVEIGEREALARLRAVMDSLADGVITTDELGWIESINPAALRMFGCAADGLCGSNVRALLPALEAPGRAAERLAGSVREAVGRRADGTTFPVEISVSQARLWDRTIFTTIVRDITPRRSAERAEREHLDRLRQQVRKRTRQLAAADGRLAREVEQRRRAEALLGCENRTLELIATGAPLDQVFHAIDGGIRTLIPDVRCAIRVSSNGGAKGDWGDGRGLAGDEVFGSMADTKIVPPLVSGRVWVSDVEAEPLPAEELEAYRRAGVRSYWCEPISSTSGESCGVLGTYSDRPRRPDESEREVCATLARLGAIAVERVRGEERARRQSAQLAHVARMATMGEMASGLAHELNQPLCAIVNFTEACVELVRSGGANGEALRGALNDVSRQALRAGAVIRRLREFVRRREPHREPVDVNVLVREVVGLTRAEARLADAALRLRLAKGLPRAMADPVQVQQVLVNLVRNGLEALGGAEPGKRAMTIRTAWRAGQVEVSVSDTGRGIAAEHRERLFEPFFTTKRDGMGLGLSISRSILELHEGRIWLVSRRRGCTFRFTLPVACGSGS